MSGITSLVQAAGVIEHKMETVSNNLANVNTVGFQGRSALIQGGSFQLFKGLFQNPWRRDFLSHEYLDDYVGMDKSAVIVDEVGKNFEPGTNTIHWKRPRFCNYK